MRAVLIVGVVAAALGLVRERDGVAQSPTRGENTDPLVARARQQPDTVRDLIARALADASHGSAASDTPLLRARRLAAAYRMAWQDSFFIWKVDRFARTSRANRVALVKSDSLRIAGVAALSREGAPAAMRLWRESLRAGKAAGDPSVVAASLLSIGAGFYRLGQLDSANAYLTRASYLARRVGDVRTEGNALGVLASVMKERGDVQGAAALYVRASAVRARSGDTRGIGADANNLGLLAQERGDLPAAKRYFTRALTINRQDRRFTIVALNLGNLATVASEEGDYAGADSLYRQALSLHRRTGDRAESGYVIHNLGRLLVRRGEYEAAESAFKEALRIHEESGAVADALAVRVDLASVENAVGSPEVALISLRDAEQKARAGDVSSALRANIAVTRADLLTQFGTFASADSAYLRAAALYADAKNARGVADVQQGRALLKHLRGDDIAALDLLRQAQASYAAARDARSSAITGIITSEIQRSRGDLASARTTLLGSLNVFQKLGDPVGEASALSSLGDVALSRGMISDSEQSYRRAIDRLGRRRSPEVFWRVHSGLADALRARGAVDEAALQYRTAIAAIEKTASGVRVDERRSGFLADKWDVYTRLALLEQSRARAAQAFEVSERMRARQMLDILARGKIREVSASSTREQDLRRRIGELTTALESRQTVHRTIRGLPDEKQSSSEIGRELDALQRQYADHLLEIQEKDPQYAKLVSPATVTARSVASRLRPNEALLEYLLGDSTSTVFIVTTDTIAAVSLSVSREDVADLVEFARRTIERPSTGNGDALWRVPLKRLQAQLIAPVEKRGYLRGRSSLIIVPHAELYFLSFSTLMAAGARDRFLVEQYQVSYTPSATTWIRLGERPTSVARSRVVAFAPRTDLLPASRDEVMAIKRIYANRATVRVGRSASKKALRADLPGSGTVHLATSGVLNKHNPLFSFVELAPGTGADSRLEVNEVFGLGLSGQLVVLSACQTALGSGSTSDVPAGDEWVGLVQAFLQGGASSVVASLWPVEDRSTAQLMEAFHVRLAAGRSPAAALAEAQRLLLKKASTARPFYWAGFVVNGGASRPGGGS